jgi:hypothetical protein
MECVISHIVDPKFESMGHQLKNITDQLYTITTIVNDLKTYRQQIQQLSSQLSDIAIILKEIKEIKEQTQQLRLEIAQLTPIDNNSYIVCNCGGDGGGDGYGGDGYGGGADVNYHIRKKFKKCFK